MNPTLSVFILPCNLRHSSYLLLSSYLEHLSVNVVLNNSYLGSGSLVATTNNLLVKPLRG